MSSYQQKCEQPIPIGIQRYAYQCESVVFEPVHGKINIRAYPPHNGGKEPYPNPEKDLIAHYELEIGRFTNNSIELTLKKVFKDKSEKLYLTNTSFSILANLLFEGHPANVFKQEAPVNHFPKQ